MRVTLLCLCLSLLPAWCRQSEKPSPFEVKTQEKRSLHSSPAEKNVPVQPEDSSGNTGIATFYRASASSRDREW